MRLFRPQPGAAHPLGWLSRTLDAQRRDSLGSRLAGKTSLRQLCHICAGASLRADQHSELPARSFPHPRIVYVDFEIPHMLRQTGLSNHILTSLEVPVTSALRLDDFVEFLAAAISSPYADHIWTISGRACVKTPIAITTTH